MATNNKDNKVQAQRTSKLKEGEEYEIKVTTTLIRKRTGEVISEKTATRPAPSLDEYDFTSKKGVGNTYSKVAKPIIGAMRESGNRMTEEMLNEASKKSPGPGSKKSRRRIWSGSVRYRKKTVQHHASERSASQ